ncbi:hypothetical protein PF002_g27738 [Phytophthora fragariae]|uniref:Uncharacterized protein n=1 Tax=Phytophthora fragariae TaxID=53985 RepID=A0A6A3WBF3_9STRA|nr:hypothetical protein PF003_g2616 [Phytophthora fragariae]KAE9072019.1 hypothetical protein PF007_g26332 [Phytophthora fragariae]KAE9179723.1 hypothetical protein PF002_g27738 [Phytophthora fragariae]
MADKDFIDFSPKLRPSISQRAFSTVGKVFRSPGGPPQSRFILLAHRLTVFALAILYVEISLNSFSTAVTILLGSVSHNLPIETHTSSLINAYAGTTTIQESPLVQQVLQGSTSPRNDSLFLLSETTQSSTGCLDAWMY